MAASLQSCVLSSLPEEILTQFNRIEENTRNRLSNLPRSKTRLPTIENLQGLRWPKDFVVLARGPSFFRQDYVKTLKLARRMGHKFAIICADGVVAHCLEQDLVPDVAATVDPSIRILRWFGDVIGANDKDEYFLKDRDAPKDNKALLSKERTISLLDEYGFKLKIAANPFIHPQVLDRLISISADVYMYLPMSDDESWMRNLWEEYPRYMSLNAGGNVGTLCYSICQFLGAQRVALCGLDFGYPPGTPLEETQYFDHIAANPALAEKMFFKISNPHLEKTWFTDLIYLMYARSFIQMARNAKQRDIETVNCTGGGIINDDSIDWRSLTEFLRQTPNS